MSPVSNTCSASVNRRLFPSEDAAYPRLVASEWDEVADEWDRAASVRAYAAAAFDSLVEVAATAGVPLRDARVCDFGCGTGLLTEHLAAHCSTIDAVDSSPAMLARLAAKVDQYGWTHVRTFGELPDSAELPHAIGSPHSTGSYDIVVCSSVLAFVDDHPATVAALAARLRSGGLFVQWDWEAEPDDPDHAGLSRNAIERALDDAGLVGGSIEPAFTIEADGERMQPLRAWGVRA